MPQPSVVLSLMRYVPSKKHFEYKPDEKMEAMEIPESEIATLTASMAAKDKKMAEIFEFLVKNARGKPGQWAEASSQGVSKGQATV
jgi:hypothetical protein